MKSDPPRLEELNLLREKPSLEERDEFLQRLLITASIGGVMAI